MPERPRPEELAQQVQKLNEAVTHPAFLEMLEEISKLPEDERFKAASERGTPEALARRGVPLPDGMRVTTRYFEDPQSRFLGSVALATEGVSAAPGRASIVEELASKDPDILGEITRSRPDLIDDLAGIPRPGLAARPTVCVSVGFIVCATIGGEI
jgi:hypothetical protein